MKTALEWLQEAKKNGHPWADAALKNYDHAHASAQPDPDTLSQAINFAFDWHKPPEGYNYWQDVCRSMGTAPAPAPTLSDLVNHFTELKAVMGIPEAIKGLREPHRSTVIEAINASRKEELEEVKGRILEALEIEAPKQLMGWVVQNEDGGYSKCIPPSFTKGDGGWFMYGVANWSDITLERASALCDRLPKWSDDEPTPIYK